MNISDCISRIRRSVHDISGEYTDEECLGFLSDAVQETAQLLASLKYAPLIRETILTTGDRLPSDFLASVGTHPYRLTDGRVHLTGERERMTLRYYGAPAPLTLGGTLPFAAPLDEAVILAATIRALKRNEYDTSAEEAQLASLRQAFALSLTQGGTHA